ncbi:MAG: hypothetical protein ABJG88_12195, partial [Litorimonas sp.]
MQNSVKRQSSKSALVLGAGYTARAFIAHLQANGYDVSATRRAKPICINGVTEIPLTPTASPELKHAFETADVIVSSVPPFKTAFNKIAPSNISRSFADPILAILSNFHPKTSAWIGYLSATSVYGDLSGEWAYEDSPVNPSLRRGKARANAEIAWIETGWPVHIFRLAGIYGKARNPFEKLRTGKARAVIKDGHIVNRIHVEDICSALLKSIAKPSPQRIYNLADGHPAPPQDVLYYAADLINAARPKTVSVDSSEISAMARTFYAETKRVDISRAKAELGWLPKYPHYQAGLRAILKHNAL